MVRRLARPRPSGNRSAAEGGRSRRDRSAPHARRRAPCLPLQLGRGAGVIEPRPPDAGLVVSLPLPPAVIDAIAERVAEILLDRAAPTLPPSPYATVREA